MASFSPRTTCPDRSNPYYTSTYNIFARSGYGMWENYGNCFSGDTRAITSIGILPLSELVDKEFQVPDIHGVWMPATCKYFGKAKLWEIEVGRYKYRCTSDHEWPRYSMGDKFQGWARTDTLRPGQQLKYQFTSEVEHPLIAEGVRHGFIYGDGWKSSPHKTVATIRGANEEFMPVWFSASKIHTRADGVFEVYRQLERGKQLPDLCEPVEYLYSFLVGYFAADGSLDTDGSTICITSSKLDELQQVRALFARVGIRCAPVHSYLTDGYTGLRLIHKLNINKVSLTANFFLNPYHKAKFLTKPKKRISLSTIKSVKPLDVEEDVYCIVQPETRSFTLDNFIITSNCTSYAYGRFSEIMGKECSLPTGNAGTWYGTNESRGTYEYGQTPQLGAVCCWSKPSAAGHVAIVEKINSDGSILISESGYGSGYFWTSTQRGPNWYSSSYNFQGFIYNPAVKGLTDTLSSFIKCAELHVHETNSWVCSKTDITAGSAWSAAFVIAVAKETGDMLGKVLYNSTSATTLITNSVLNQYGSVKQSNPEPGDLIIFTGYKLGIITAVNQTRMTVVAGDQGTNLTQKFYKETTSKDVVGYYRPNWNASESNVLNLSTYVPLYDELNDRHDATIREVGYLNSSMKPSLSTSNITLSMVNYTTELNSLHKLIYQNSASNITTDSSAESANIGKLLRYDKSEATPVKTVTIPSSVKQTGIIRNYTNYSYFYSRWASNTTQRRLADIWASKGRTQSRNIATIDGYYLVAMSSKFATTGDIVVVELENGDKFKAILGDSKGSDAGSEWGHYFGSAVDIIEWESIGDAQNGSTKLDLGTWAGQDVVKVYNYGPYLV